MTALARELSRPKRPPVSDAGTLHARIQDDIKQRISTGHWPPGHRIPFEIDLARSYACSRMTVNKALRELAHTGLIERRRKAGSFVCAPKSQAPLLEIRDIKDEVEALGLVYRFVRLGLRKRLSSETDRRRLGLTKTMPVLAITCLHLGSETPFCYEDRLINVASIPVAVGETFRTIAPGPWLVSHVPWTEAEHRIRADSPNARIAAHLRISTSTPCLMVDRMTWSERDPLTHVRFVYLGGARELVARFRPATR